MISTIEEKKNEFVIYICIDILDNEWLGQGFQEHLYSLESAISRLENSDTNSKQIFNEKPKIVITQASSAERTIQLANDEYDELMQMLVK